ncbi:MAG: hypothetical protein ACI8XC_003750 [Gammaproteobacteria bacterium]
MIAALLGVGVTLESVIVFWIALPTMNPDRFVLATSEIVLNFSIVKTLVVDALGLMAGFSILLS